MLKELDSNKLPVFKFYSNKYIEAPEKSAKAYELILPRDGDLTSTEGLRKISEIMIEEMNNGINYKVKEI